MKQQLQVRKQRIKKQREMNRKKELIIQEKPTHISNKPIMKMCGHELMNESTKWLAVISLDHYHSHGYLHNGIKLDGR